MLTWQKPGVIWLGLPGMSLEITPATYHLDPFVSVTVFMASPKVK
jgi:hypothetical protein